MKITNINIVPTGVGKMGEALPSDVIITFDDGSSKTIPTVIPPGSPGQRGSIWNAGSGLPVVTSKTIYGDMWYNTDNNTLYHYNGASWVVLGVFAGTKGDQGVSVSTVTFETDPTTGETSASGNLIFGMSDLSKHSVPITIPAGPRGANGGPDPYAPPQWTNFGWTELGALGSSAVYTREFPYGIVFKRPPHVTVTLFMEFPNDEWHNYTDRWTGEVRPQTLGYVNTNGELLTVSHDAFIYRCPTGWVSQGYAIYNVSGIVDPDATAAKQAAKNITPPPRMQDLTLSSIDIKQTTPVAGMPSVATMTATLSDGSKVGTNFTIPTGPKGDQGIPGDGPPPIGLIEAYWCSDSIDLDTRLILDGGKYDTSRFPDYFKLTGKDTTDDFRGVFLRGRDPIQRFDSDASRLNTKGPTLQKGSVLVGGSQSDAIVVPDLSSMKINNGQNPMQWDLANIDKNSITSGVNFIGSANMGPANGSSVFGVARPVNMNVIWAVRAR